MFEVGRSVTRSLVTVLLVCPVIGRCGDSQVEALVANLTSEDEKIAAEGRQKLEALGADVVPALFEKLLSADWTLRPRLLEVLSANGREFAKQKLKNGSDTERTYAALVYELSVACAADEHDYASPAFRAMAESLLKSLKSDDKYLCSAACAALLHDAKSALVFEHYHAIVPAMISCFDVDLVIAPPTMRGGFVTFADLCQTLDAIAGDRLAFLDAEPSLQQRAKAVSLPPGASDRAQMHAFIDANKRGIEMLREYWSAWWRQNSTKSMGEIGAMLIERNLAILKTEPSTETARAKAALDSLTAWTGSPPVHSTNEWQTWWNENKKSYSGPLGRGTE